MLLAFNLFSGLEPPFHPLTFFLQLNRAEFENLPKEMRQDLEGFRPGLYLRVEVAGIPCEFVEHFNPSSPLIIGGLTNLEENVGYVQVSIPGGVLVVFASCFRSVWCRH